MCVLKIHMWLLFKLVYLLFFLKWIRNRFGAFKMIHLTVVFKVSNHLKMFQAVYVKISEPVVVNWHKWMKSDSFVCWKFYSYLVLFFFYFIVGSFVGNYAFNNSHCKIQRHTGNDIEAHCSLSYIPKSVGKCTHCCIYTCAMSTDDYFTSCIN